MLTVTQRRVDALSLSCVRRECVVGLLFSVSVCVYVPLSALHSFAVFYHPRGPLLFLLGYFCSFPTSFSLSFPFFIFYFFFSSVFLSSTLQHSSMNHVLWITSLLVFANNCSFTLRFDQDGVCEFIRRFK